MEEGPTTNTNPLGENEIETYVDLIDSEDLYSVKITRKKNDIIFNVLTQMKISMKYIHIH